MNLHINQIKAYDNQTDGQQPDLLHQNTERGYTKNEGYDPEAVTNFYEELSSALALAPDYRKMYNVFNHVFMKCINQCTGNVRIKFVGPFAKTDYLLKEIHAPQWLQRTVNDARVRFKNRDHEDVIEGMKDHYLYDFKALSEFFSLLYAAPVPDCLKEKYPSDRQSSGQTGKLVGECFRIAVASWDEEYFYGKVDSSEYTDVKVCYVRGSNFYPYDWSYLRDYLYEGAQVNLVRPREEEGILYPELIILEPDYLVDISSVAACFEDYAITPFNYLLNKIKPSPNTEPILLGNFAGQLLDEEVRHDSEENSYKKSASEFFKKNALGLLTAKMNGGFHEEAKRQKQNIRNAIKTDLPSMVSSFKAEEVILEPSFFSEMLGLQGRMDLLQLDHRFLIEQKSGKGGYPQKDPDTPEVQEKHYVQMLLYVLLLRYNYREQYERNNHELQEFLLYSKYKNSLVGLGFAPRLIFEAIKVRNGIAWSEIQYAKGGIKILEDISADSLNYNQISSTLWERYQKKQIEDLLSPIRMASDLERSYYFRFMTFLEAEHLLAKFGNKTKENSGFAAKWHDSLDDKLQSGNIYDNLMLESPGQGFSGKVERVVLTFKEHDDNDMSNFRNGDIVILYPYDEGKEPDVRRSMVFRCSIEDIGLEQITLSLRAAQSDGHVFLRSANKKWAIEHDFFDSSFASLYRGMHAFLSAPKERRDLILLQRKPEVDENIQLRGDYGRFNDLTLRTKRAKDLFLIIGPPGTGKTSYGLLNTLREELLTPSTSVLLMSYTNHAVDEICSKLKEDEIDFIRIGGRLTCPEEYRAYLLESKVAGCLNTGDLDRQIRGVRVFVGTTTAFNSCNSIFQLKHFDLAIIDEASQILEPHLMGLLSATDNSGRIGIDKFVLIGDHKQLPAVVQQDSDESRVNGTELNGIYLTDCRLSLFERLLRQYRDDENVTYMLTKQGRMHHDIALFPNEAFYENRLQEVPLDHQNVTLSKSVIDNNGITNILTTRRIAFIDVKAPEGSVSDKVNQTEADIIAATVVKIYELNKESFDTNRTVGVIVPYRNQIATVRNTLDKYGIGLLHDITIDTVERYQGSQRDYIIYGFTIQKYYQLDFLTNNVFEEGGAVIDRKLNVAMTRAREHLLMVGNEELLNNNFTFFKLIEFIRSKQGVFYVRPSDYVKGAFKVSERSDEDFNLSQAQFSISDEFEKAYLKHVLEPIRTLSGEGWPSLVLGRDSGANLDAIGYGRIHFLNRAGLHGEENDEGMSQEEMTLLYCYYMMRANYGSCRAVYQSVVEWMDRMIEDHRGRLQLIDIGCGPATAGIAFAELFREKAPEMLYTGIDKSLRMKEMGEKMVDSVFEGKLRMKSLNSFEELDESYWDACSELSTLVVFNFSSFFSNISAQSAEHLAQMMVDVIRKYPLNSYVFIIQHSVFDANLNSYKVFRNKIAPSVKVCQSQKSSIHYVLDGEQQSLDFYYEVSRSQVSNVTVT